MDRGRPRCRQRDGLTEARRDGAVAADYGRRTALRGQHGGRLPSGPLGGGLAAMSVTVGLLPGGAEGGGRASLWAALRATAGRRRGSCCGLWGRVAAGVPGGAEGVTAGESSSRTALRESWWGPHVGVKLKEVP